MTEFIRIEPKKKVYSNRMRRIRIDLGLDPGYMYDEDGNLVPFRVQGGKCLIDLNNPPKPISHEKLLELMKERDAHERTAAD